MASNTADNAQVVRARLILQQCLSARLQVQPPTEEREAQYVMIDRGLVIYVCFMKGAAIDMVDQIVKAALGVKLTSGDSGKLVSILELPGDILIVPQATLGGKLKGKVMQYHGNIDKESGLQLYTAFVDKCKNTAEKIDGFREANCGVKWGTYGNIQVLRMDTNGPYSHLLEF